MPLTECPDCGGVVSDAAFTCPTCHRVLRSIEAGGAPLSRHWVQWVLFGLVAVVLIWVVVKVT